MRTCPFSGCDKPVSPDKFGCPSHWFSLTKEEQAEIWDAYRDYTADRITLKSLRTRQDKVLKSWADRHPNAKAISNGKCRSCGRPVLWVEMLGSGRKNPLDPEPTDKGNVVLVGEGKAEVVRGADKSPGELLYLSHFATCKFAKQHRKPK